MTIATTIQSELLKTKRTASLYLTFIAGAFGPLMSMLELLLDGVKAEERQVILTKIFTSKFEATGFLLFPMFTILICTLLPQIEYKNNAWKQVLTSPQSKANIFIAKFVNVHLLIFLFLIANQLCMLIVAVVLHFAQPSLNVLGQSLDGASAFSTVANSYVTILAMSALQFWMGLRFRNFILPIAVGISCWFIGSLMVMEWKPGFERYFPYSFHVYSSIHNIKEQVEEVKWTSVYYTAVVLILGFLDFRRKRFNA